MLKRMFVTVSMLSLLCSNAVYAGSRYPYDSNIRSDISTYEQQTGQHVLTPTWLPPNYEQINTRLAGKRLLAITYAQEHRHDGSIDMQVISGVAEIKDIHLSKIKLENGRTAYFKEERLEGPFDNVPSDSDYVRLYFYDSGLLYTLGMGSKAISTVKMKRIIIKVANSMS
ncbi:hypothetical protein SAMN05216378_3699 [Paenibacillus catalpae]|uniref:DUF4367 domain-containing protein n=1 Tax=Paenibacillus catalpae TaxID=1045775 RepID=A0A1I2BWK4_9BACL|nr:hypothetical protein [Paenibacillus catalpae]SFE60546.1 hypothetical protein SAMN05216378_3699 [Paenibacillus catalpae]